MTFLYIALFLLSHVAVGDQLQITDKPQTAAAPVPESLLVLSAEPSLDINDDDLHRSLRFEPASLDFGSWTVGTARSFTVTLLNQNANRSVYLSSVSGRTPAFYSSFFETKVVAPQSNTSFSVVFLPRDQGTIETDLLVHTSFGQARLQVRGEGRECPYRLKPIVGVKAPLNATLTPEIHLYNPHERSLQIIEVYSSGGQFQLELPSGSQEGPQTLWEIPPHEMKPVIRIRFHGGLAGNYTAYIRIKISEQPSEAYAPRENVLVIPVQFEILPVYGLYAESPLLDFGRLTTKAQAPIQLKLHLRNSHERRLHELLTPDLGSTPGLTYDPTESSLTLDPKVFTESMALDELLLLRAASKRNASLTHEFSVILRAEIFKGTLHFDRNSTVFVTQKPNMQAVEPRSFVVRNDFEFPLALLNVSVEKNETDVLEMRFSQIFPDSSGIIVAPGESLELLQLRVLNGSRRFRSLLKIYTNVTHFEVPIVVCSGRLHVTTHDAGRMFAHAAYNLELNLGAVPLAEKSHDGYIVVQNRNPIAIKLTTWDFESPRGVYFLTNFLGCLNTAALQQFRNETLKIEHAKFRFCSQLQEGDVAVFQVAIQSYSTDHIAASLKIWSTYENITATVKFKAWVGKLEVDQEQLYFKNCFPGKVCSSDLSIRSTFQYPIHVTSLNFTDPGLRFEDFKAKGSTIAPEAVTKVGRIYFEPAQLCQNRCYIPLDDKTNELVFPSPQEKKGIRNNNLHFDEPELRRRTELFRHLRWYFQTISFTLSSREVRQFMMQLIVDIEWPKLVVGQQILPTIEVGKMQQIPVLLRNPADSAILVDYFLADPKYAQQTKLSLPLEVVDLSTHCFLTDKPVFSLSGGALRQPVLVPPHATIPLLIGFEAHEADTHCTLLHIRNNLTLYEAVWLSAKTVQSQFRFGNRKSGSNTPLLFEINEKHLAICAQHNLKNMDNSVPPVFTKRIFTARNTGEIPIWVETFFIGDQKCEGYGFKVLDCESFELRANSSKRIEILFTPDFTATRVRRPLLLRTNLTYDVSYTLLAQLPPVSFDQCANLLPRPAWEQSIRNAAIVLLATTFVFVLIAAHIDYGNILISQSALYMSREKGPVQPTFNLRNIVAKSQTTEEPILNATTQSCTVNKTTATGSGGNSSGISNLKKRSIKKFSSNGSLSGETTTSIGRKLSLSDIGGWPLELSTVKEAVVNKNTPTFSERNFKLRLDLAISSNSSSSISSNESTKSTPPLHKAIPNKTKDSSLTESTSATSNSNEAKKSQSRGVKKSKQAANDKLEREQRAAPIQKFVSKAIKANEKLATATTPTNEPAQMKTSTAKIVTETVLSSLDAYALQQKRPPSIAKDNPNSIRKHGKTPGRERRQNAANNSTASSTSSTSSSSNTKRSERKQKTKAVNALNFGAASPPISAFDGNAMANLCVSPWEAGQVSFSDILQLQSSQVNNATECFNNIDMHNLKTKMVGMSEQQQQLDFQHNRTQQQLNATHKTATSKTATTIDKGNCSELGPIGSKKSPSSTPVWESVTVTSAANLQLQKPTISNNSSFFSNLLPTYSTYEESQSQQQSQQQQQQQQQQQVMGGMQVDQYELKKAQEELQRQWQTNEYILGLRQQQLQAQQQLLQNVAAPSSWALNSPTWTPMGYGHGQNVVGNNNAPATSIGALGTWQNTGVVRPPPGLEVNFQNANQTQQQTQQQQAPLNRENVPSSAQVNAANMQTFDPFSSLSSIWSDNWNKNPNQRNNN